MSKYYLKWVVRYCSELKKEYLILNMLISTFTYPYQIDSYAFSNEFIGFPHATTL